MDCQIINKLDDILSTVKVGKNIDGSPDYGLIAYLHAQSEVKLILNKMDTNYLYSIESPDWLLTVSYSVLNPMYSSLGLPFSLWRDTRYMLSPKHNIYWNDRVIKETKKSGTGYRINVEFAGLLSDIRSTHTFLSISR